MDPDRERQQQLKDERYREWQTRRRGPGDLVTWMVVLGGVMAVLLFFSSAYDGNTLLGAGIGVLIIAWLLAVWVLGGVNVPAILWGRSAPAELAPERERVVFIATTVLAVACVVLPILDLLSTLDFGWYGVIALAVGTITLGLLLWPVLRQ